MTEREWEIYAEGLTELGRAWGLMVLHEISGGKRSYQIRYDDDADEELILFWVGDTPPPLKQVHDDLIKEVRR